MLLCVIIGESESSLVLRVLGVLLVCPYLKQHSRNWECAFNIPGNQHVNNQDVKWCVCV